MGLATVVAAASESRLLEFGAGDQVWATPEEVDAFTLSGRNFFDVTGKERPTRPSISSYKCGETEYSVCGTYVISM